MKPADPCILTINGGSSSIKFALFEAGDSLRRILGGGIERIGLPEATFRVKGLNQADNFLRLVTAPDHTVAVGCHAGFPFMRKPEFQAMNAKASIKTSSRGISLFSIR